MLFFMFTGAVFDKTTDEIQEAFKLAVIQFSNANRTRWEFQLFVDVINTADAFKLSRLSKYTVI